jgi:hypothetical protein
MSPGMRRIYPRIVVWKSRSTSATGEVELLFVPEDVERAIEPATQCDCSSWRRKRCRDGPFQLNEFLVKGDRVIVVDTSSGLKTKDVFKGDSLSRSMKIPEVMGVGKALVVITEVEPFEKSVGFIDGADVGTSECFDQTVLMSTITTFDTSFRLG